MHAALVTIGEEILIGQIVDTNSAWMATKLNAIGVNVKQIISIGDTMEEITSTIGSLIGNFDVILITGGLGPTNDDITKQALCNFFNSQLVVHEPSLEKIKKIFEHRGLPLTQLNAKQAEVPHNCRVLINNSGTAPAMLFEQDNSMLISMPGVPFEMKAIMEEHVLPEIQSRSNGQIVYHKTIQTFGLPESFLAERIAPWENNLPKNIALAYLPSPYSIRLRLSLSGQNESVLKSLVEEQIQKLIPIIPEAIFGYDDDTMADVVGRLLMERNATLCVAESCTGGTIAQQLTAIPGSSRFFMGGVVAYSNDAKIKQLAVNNSSIEQYGAVSQQVVEDMALGAKALFQTQYAIATSGIAGPDGGTPQKPVGTIWIAIATPTGVKSAIHNFGGDRRRNIIRSSITALNMLRREILEEK